MKRLAWQICLEFDYAEALIENLKFSVFFRYYLHNDPVTKWPGFIFASSPLIRMAKTMEIQLSLK